MPITILQLAESRGVKPDEHGHYNMQQFWDVGLDLLGGCQVCEATIAAYNAYPSKTGYWLCEDHIGDLGFETAQEYEEWEVKADTPEHNCSNIKHPEVAAVASIQGSRSTIYLCSACEHAFRWGQGLSKTSIAYL